MITKEIVENKINHCESRIKMLEKENVELERIGKNLCKQIDDLKIQCNLVYKEKSKNDKDIEILKEYLKDTKILSEIWNVTTEIIKENKK